MISQSMIWMLRALALIDTVVALVYVIGPDRLF